jgi:hypothetical protein
MISKNLHRRLLSVSQRAALALEWMPRLMELGRVRMVEGGRSGGRGGPQEKVRAKSREPLERDRRSDVIAAKILGVGASSITAVQQVKKVDPNMFERVKAGELGTEAARRHLGLGASGGRKPYARNSKVQLRAALAPLRAYLRNWQEDRLSGISPGEAQRLLKQVQEVDVVLLEVERAPEARTVSLTRSALTESSPRWQPHCSPSRFQI